MPLTPQEILNEKNKPFANALDRASTSCITLGILGPIAAGLFNFPGIKTDFWLFAVYIICWSLAAFALHVNAQRVMDRLR